MRSYLWTEGRLHISFYDIGDHEGVSPYISEAPFRFDRFAARGVRDYQGRTWREIHSAGEHQFRPEWLNIVTVDIEDAHAAAFSRSYNDLQVREIVGCPGWLANRRYECINVDPRFLAICELVDDAERFNGPERERAAGWDEQVDQIRGFHGFRVCRLTYDSADT